MIVVDTNVVAYLMLSTSETDRAIEVRRKDPDWAAPGLWRSEFRSMLMLYVRRGDLDLQIESQLVGNANMRVKSRAVASDHVLSLALQSGCTAYDCEFVSLADRLQVPLVTSDKQVLKAFPSIAVTMKDFATS